MKLKEFYRQINGAYDDVLQRLLSEERVLRFVKKFAEDTTFDDLTDAVNSGRIDAIFLSAHTLKGISSTLGFTELNKTSSQLTEYLRNNDSPSMDEVHILYNEVKKSVQEICFYLRSLQE